MTGAETNLESFSGARLRIARAFNGITQIEVATQVGIRHQFIAALENNRKQPSVLLERALEDALGFDRGFFRRALVDEFTEGQCSFRRWQTTPVSARTKAMAWGTLLGEFLSLASAKLTLPSENLPRADASAADEIERTAERCRMQWGVGLDLPITNMTRALESLAGVAIARFRGLAHQLDAFSRPGTPSVIVLNDKSPSRCRFDLAHECGHLILHRGKLTGTPETEAEANRFGGALLLPRAAFAREFPPCAGSGMLEILLRLKRRWGASVAAIIKRASELSLIDSVQYRRLYKFLSARGWLRSEPEEPEPEPCEIIPLVFEGMREYYQLNPVDIAGMLRWKPDTLATVTGVPVTVSEPQKPKATIFELATRKIVE
jgi:Zn-dependent peptidase ImmA (M78 family)/DNA-binding XRE family transcriptional regulator